MEKKETEKAPKVASKSFMTAGPTLHYSHRNVQRCWLLAIASFALTCLFWSRILTGSFWSFSFESITFRQLWYLGRFTTTGVGIFEYPWQIFVLGLLMGVLGIVPVVVSQLMSFSYSVPFILATFFLANLPAFAVSLLISCVAVACRPLRFRSRFTAIVLCTAPQLLYWGFFGGAKGLEPLKFGFSFAPWIGAWLAGLALAGIILGIGHFTRYRPGLVWTSSLVVFLAATIVFELKIGFDELDYQLYIARNNPEQAIEFYGHSITEALDETIANPTVRRYLTGFFYPAEPIQLRAELKREIQNQLSHDRWPSWFIVPEQLNYQAKKQWLFEQYDMFINRRFKSRRMPIALYYKALLSEYSADIETLGRSEVLQFYSDYPHERSRKIWYRLYEQFPDSPESLEARWRIAMHWAGQRKFEQAEQLLLEAQTSIGRHLKLLAANKPQAETLFSLFHPPTGSAMTLFKLTELQRKLNQLLSLIGAENRTGAEDCARRLAGFVMLDPRETGYDERLDELLAETDDTEQLRDNLLLAKAKLIVDEQLRAEKLSQLHEKYKDTDGGMQALYELGLLKIGLWRKQEESNSQQKKRYLADARATLAGFIDLYPDSFCAEQVKKNLDDLPIVE